ncbi:MAG: Fe2+-dependent dioxygenase [Janthinobacterium lividum]
MIVLDAVLSAAEVADMRGVLAGASWASGRDTAGWQAAGVKENGQLVESDPLARALGDQVLAALERCKPFIAAALPLRVYPPMFNRYAGGQAFGAHVDTAIRQVPWAPARVRADLSATLFLSEPDSYDGGELIVEDETGARAAKLPAGSMVLYGAGTVHRVAPVTRGERLAAFTWVQSMVRDTGQRELLLELDRGIQVAAAANSETVRLTGVYHNLLRRWADC